MIHHAIDRLARAGAAVAEALTGRDAAVIESTIKAMDAAVAEVRAADVWKEDGRNAATLRALAASLEAATAHVGKLTGAVRRRHALRDAIGGCSLRTERSERIR